MSFYSPSQKRRWRTHLGGWGLTTQAPLCFICSGRIKFFNLLFICFWGTLKALTFSSRPLRSADNSTQACVLDAAPRLQIFQKKRAQLVLSLLTPTQDSLYYLPLIQASGSLTASATSLGRKLRASPLAQLLTCHFVRRYLVSLAKLNFELWVKGGVGLFSAAWRHLISPVDEVYWNPLSQSWVFDTKVLKSDFGSLLNTPTAEVWADLAGWRIVSNAPVASFAWESFKLSLGKINESSRSHTGQWLYRYNFSWGLIFFQPVRSFGAVKAPKMRRLPRRQTKRLVKQAQTRFWVW